MIFEPRGASFVALPRVVLFSQRLAVLEEIKEFVLLWLLCVYHFSLASKVSPCRFQSGRGNDALEFVVDCMPGFCIYCFLCLGRHNPQSCRLLAVLSVFFPQML